MDNLYLKKALVTGGTGFIGSNLIKRLLLEQWEVHIIVRQDSSLDLIGSIADIITIHKYDGNVRSIINAVKRAKPNVVFHLGSLFVAQHSPEDIEKLIASNLIFGTQLLEAMVSNNTKYLVNTGTSWQYYSGTFYEPVNLYAATKQAYEDILRFYLISYNLKATTLILSDTYGPNDPRRKLIPLLCNFSNTSGIFEMSAGEQMVDFVFIDDVVDAFVKVAQLIPNQNSDHVRYGVSSNRKIRLKDCISIFESVTGKKIPIKWGARPYRPREMMKPWIPENQVPGWEPKISLEVGFLRSFSSYITK